jgi:hypothetical protein
VSNAPITGDALSPSPPGEEGEDGGGGFSDVGPGGLREQIRGLPVIAERIAARLTEAGLRVELRSVKDAGDPADHDAFVIGRAVCVATG